MLGGLRPQAYVHNPIEWVDPLGLTGHGHGDEPNDNLSSAFEILDELPNSIKKTKTVASDSIIYTLSGYSSKKPKIVKHVDAQKVIDRSNENGHILKTHKLFDRGIEGQFYAYHAEKQLIVDNPLANHIGVTRPMCKDCQAFFIKEAKYQNRAITVVDPKTVRTFLPDGTVRMKE